jgi:hypothetical protein
MRSPKDHLYFYIRGTTKIYIFKNMSFKIVSIKYLRLSLMKVIKNMHTQKFKMSLRESKEILLKWKHVSAQEPKDQYYKGVSSPQVIYRFIAVAIKIPANIFVKNWRGISRFYMKYKESTIGLSPDKL